MFQIAPALITNIAALSGGGGGGGGGLDGSESDGTNILFTGEANFTSGWSNLNGSLTANTAAGADGTTTAAYFLENTNNSRHGVYATPTIGGGNTRTYSIYAKSITRQYLQVIIANNAGTSAKIYAYFDLSGGTVTDSAILVNSGVTTLGTCTIEAGANGYWKCTLPGVKVNNTDNTPYWQLMCSDVATYGAPLSSDSPSFTGNTSNGLRLWRPKVT